MLLVRCDMILTSWHCLGGPLLQLEGSCCETRAAAWYLCPKRSWLCCRQAQRAQRAADKAAVPGPGPEPGPAGRCLQALQGAHLMHPLTVKHSQDMVSSGLYCCTVIALFIYPFCLMCLSRRSRLRTRRRKCLTKTFSRWSAMRCTSLRSSGTCSTYRQDCLYRESFCNLQPYIPKHPYPLTAECLHCSHGCPQMLGQPLPSA